MALEQSVAVLVLVGAFLCTAHLCGGLAIGWCMGRQTRPSTVIHKSAAKRKENVPSAPQPSAGQVDSLRLAVAELSRLAKRNEVTLPREFTTLLADLVKAVDELHRAIAAEAPRPAVQPSPVPAPDQLQSDESDEPADRDGHHLGTNEVGNGRILEWFHRDAGWTASATPVVAKRRYPFAVSQPIAPRKGEALPRPDAFRAVQCHDLSARDIRYVVEHRPKEDEVVIGLGIPQPVKFLAARIEDYRSVYMYGIVGYLVSASFQAAIDDEQYRYCFGKLDSPARAREPVPLREGVTESA